jgi:hypothetical protein
MNPSARSVTSLLIVSILAVSAGSQVSPGAGDGLGNGPILTPAAQRRPTEQTFLTFPEWFLVFSPAEYAAFVRTSPPDEFPFLGHIRQFWQSYGAVARAANDGYPMNVGYHAMIMVIGTSTTVEYLIKSAYETVIARIARVTHDDPVDEDRFAARFASDYVGFIRVRPWYEYDFDRELVRLWTEVPLAGPGLIRRYERKYILTTEFIVKAIYGRLIGGGTHATYAPELSETAVVLDRRPPPGTPLRDFEVLSMDAVVPVLARAPRYQAFTEFAVALSAAGVSFAEIAGNRSVILVTVLRRSDAPVLANASLLFTQPILTVPGRSRDALVVPVPQLSKVLESLRAEGAEVEHVYDY